MKRHRAIRLGAVVVALSGIAVLIPSSPVYVLSFFAPIWRYDGHSTRYWVANLHSSDPAVRKKAISAVGGIGAEAAEAVPILGRILLEDADDNFRREAAFALTKMAPASRAAVPALAAALEDHEPGVRMNAAIALFQLHGEASPAVPALIKAVKSDKNRMYSASFAVTIRAMAALALGRASNGSAGGVPVLIEVLEAPDTRGTLLASVQALGNVGPPAQPASTRLRVLLRDEDIEVREAAEEALQRIEGGAANSKDQITSGNGTADPELPEAERQYLWEIEHSGNVLTKYGFGPITAALKRVDAAALSRVLAADFSGSELREPKRVQAMADSVQVTRLQDAGQPPTMLSGPAFVARLFELRKLFANQPQVKLALMTLSPKVRGKLDGAWEGTAQLRIFGEHAKDAPVEVVLLLHYELARPTEEVLSQPGWLHSAGILQVLTAKSPHYLFAEVGKQRGLDSSKLYDNWDSPHLHPTTGGVYVCDFDRDGILDVLITDLDRCMLYRGLPGGGLQDVTARYGLLGTGLAGPVAAWIDIDGDGWDDLLVGGRVYRNEQGKHFAEYTHRCNLRVPGDALNVAVADYDGDGKLDLYITRAGRRGSESWLVGKNSDAKGNYLFRNKGNWQFEDVTKASGTMGGNRSTFTAAWLDANNDGWPDLHVINEFGDGVLLINNGDGTFSEHALADRPADFGTMGMAVGDIDNDGNIDIYCANMYSKAGSRVIGNLAPDAYPAPILEKMRRFVEGSQLHLNKGKLKFEQVGKKMQVAAVGWAYGACLADLDNDGWLDIYATAGFVSRNRNEPDG